MKAEKSRNSKLCHIWSETYLQPGIFFHEGLLPAAILRVTSNQAALPYTKLLHSTPTPWLVMAAILESFPISSSREFFMPRRSRVLASASPLIFNHPPDMSTTSSNPHVQDSSQVHKARTVSLPFLSLSLFITAMSVCGIFSPDVVGITDAQAAPSVIHIGALVSYETFIGRAAIKAIKMALDDINKDKTLLNTSVLALHLLDTNCSAFTGVAAAMQLFKQEVVAVIGPQSTAVARFVAHMATATQVPLLSFGVTDRSFSEHQYPYFFRVAHSDAMQMQAIASLIARYGWRDAVIVYIDDEYGSSTVAALSDAVQPLGVHLVEKVAVIPDSDNSSILGTLSYLSSLQPRVFVVHLPQNLSLLFFAQAKDQHMLSSGYVWIASDLMFSTLAFTALEANVFNTLQGVIGFRGYVPKTAELKAFIANWNNQSLMKETENSTIIYSLYAYDATRLLAYAIDRYIREGSNITFNNSSFPSLAAGASSDLAQFKVFEGGPSLSTSILQTHFLGTSGYVQLNSNGDLNRTAFEILNIVDQEFKVVGYWTNETQLSASPPVNVSDASFVKSQSSVLPIKWPGDLQETPRGWVLPKNGRPLKIAVPRKIGFEQFLSYSVDNITNVTTYSGYCIDVFLEALKYVPYTVPYYFELFGNESGPIYDDMIFQLAHKAFDAVVGDVTITTKRMEIVDFTQSIKDSGLVVVVPVQDTHSSYPWAFLRPFSPAMWCTTLAFFVFTGVVVWLFEHKKNRDFQGNPRKQVVTFLWFAFSTLFFSQRERTKSTYGRIVVLIWLFAVLIITSSYTANLTSILTLHQLTPVIKGISSLQSGTDAIGYQTGSFVKNYLINMNIASERLIAMDSTEAYAEALRKGPAKGGVAAVVEELPYVEVFLSTICGFTIVGDQFTKGGWGFAFPKGSQLAVDMSTAILNISENGKLRKIQDHWLMSGKCAATTSNIESIQLSLSSFWGLFLVTGTASCLSLFIYLTRLLLQFSRLQKNVLEPARPVSEKKGFIKSFASYVYASGVVKGKKQEPSGVGRKKRKMDHQPEPDILSDQMSQLCQGSPNSQSSRFSQSPPSSLSSPSYQMFPSYQSSSPNQSPRPVDNT